MSETKKNSILVIDDENSNILVLTQILSPEYTVYAAKSGKDAIQAAKKYIPDIILLDIIMPDMDGYEVISILKKQEETKDIPVIFVTGLSSAGDEEKGLDFGVADYITKPFSPAIVKLRVKNQVKLLEQRRLMEYTLKRREMMLSAVNHATSVLLGAGDSDFSASLMEGMEIIGRDMEVDCVEVWQNELRDGELYAVLKHYWFSETGRNIKSDTPVSSFSYKAIPGWESKLSKGEHIQGPVSGLSKVEQDFLSAFKIKTVLVIPAFIHNNFWGFCCIDDCRNLRNFTEDEINILRSVSYMLANTINRNEMLVNIRDTSTQLKAAMEKALEDEERMQLMLDAMPLACFLINSDKNINYVNNEAIKLLGMSDKKDYREQHLDILPELQPCGQKSLELFNEYLEKAFEEGYQRFEWLYEKVDGEHVPCDNIMIRVKHRGENIIAEYARDLREQRAVIEEIRKVEIAEGSNKAKSQFLANMSHEMRTPMNVVVGLIDLMLEEDNLAVHIKENLMKISTAGNTLLALINDVLDISKIEAGKLELTPVVYELPSHINDIFTLNMIRIGNKPIKFLLDISEDLPYSLFGDDLRVKQIINNLLSNAFKYTQNGTVKLGLHCEHTAGNIWMSIYVSDTGIGIREEDLKKLFIEYGQVDARSNREIEGTGLGLSITKRLVEMMDGTISAESEYGKGSVFHVRIRQGFVSEKTIGIEVVENLRNFKYAEGKRSVSRKIVRPDLSYIKVLIVDDMQTNLDVASGLLGKYKMQIDCVLSGQEAVERISSGQPVYNAIFMDHMMPGMDGIETANAIRNIGKDYAKNLPIIALTANAVLGTEELFYKHDFQAFLSKPIDINQLDIVIKKWISK